MAVVHAGVKRPFQQIHEGERNYLSPTPGSASWKPPTRDQSRESSLGPNVQADTGYRSDVWHEWPRKASFEPDVSIVLIGVRGVGKSSLGVLAAAAYSRRLIDSERAFTEATGATNQAYRRDHGAAAYHKKHAHVLKLTFETHDKDCVIICSFSDLENAGADIVREYAQSHPIVHITRDARGIQSHLSVWTEQRIKQLLLASGSMLRSCSNFEFHNMSEELQRTPAEASGPLQVPDTKSSNGLFLTLKRVERDFLKLLRNIIGDNHRTPSHHSAYPLSQIPVHERQFTLCVVVSVHEVLSDGVDLNDFQIGADAIELQIDSGGNLDSSTPSDAASGLFRTAEAYAQLRRATILPIILTVKGLSVDNAPATVQASQADMVGYCLRLAPEYCSIDLSLKPSHLRILLESKGRTKIIGHWHMPQKPAGGWYDPHCVSVYERADHLGCDVVKITMPATCLEDNFTVQHVRQKIEARHGNARLISYNTGRRGKTSKCFGTILTPVTAERYRNNCADDDGGAVTAKEAISALFATFTCEPLHFFIYGANVSYSLSPAMHNAAYRALGMRHSYGTHSSDTLDEFRRLSQEPEFGGAAVVQPFKIRILPLLAGMSSHARAIGSVNTIAPVRELLSDGSIPHEEELLTRLNRSGPVKALYGYNTDWIGIRACLRRGLSPANTIRPQSTALVCGAGGQARATVYAMLSLGVCNVFICNRSRENAQTLADHYNHLIETSSISELDPANVAHTRIHVLDSFHVPWPREHRQPTLIVSGIPTQNANGTPINFSIPDDWLKSPTGGVLIELAYRPMVTHIVRQMHEHAHKGWIFMDGFDILPEQAYAQFELFTGRRAPRKLMRDEVVKAFRAQQSEEGSELRNLDPNPAGQ